MYAQRLCLAAWLTVAVWLLLPEASAGEVADACPAGPQGCTAETATLQWDSVGMLQTRLSVSHDEPPKVNGTGADRPTPLASMIQSRAASADDPEITVSRNQMLSAVVFVLVCFAIVLICAQKIKTLSFCRSIPFAALSAFALFLVGEGLANVYFSSLRESLVSMKVEDVDDIMMYARLSFATLLIVNAVALSLSFLGAGCFRECIFGARSQAHPTLVRCGQCLIGPLLLMVLEILVWLTLALQLILSYVFLVAALLVKVGGIFCDKLGTDLAPAQTLLDVVGLKWSMENFCNEAHHHGHGGVCIFLGCAVTVISQVAMLMALAGEKARIEAELEKVRSPDAASSPDAAN